MDQSATQFECAAPFELPIGDQLIPVCDQSKAGVKYQTYFAVYPTIPNHRNTFSFTANFTIENEQHIRDILESFQLENIDISGA